MDEPPAPFDHETWRRMVELANFLRVHELPPEARDRLGLAIVRLRLAAKRPDLPYQEWECTRRARLRHFRRLPPSC